MVIPPAIGPSDDLHAWLLRGFVEAGLPDLTLGGFAPEGGAFSAASLRENGGIDGLCLSFIGWEGGEDWVYRAVVLGGAAHVTCRDTLFSHRYAGLRAQELGPRILADVRAHNDAFAAWLGQGGQPTLGEQRAIVDIRGEPASRALLDFVERRYRSGETLEAGPSAGWWIAQATRSALGAGIGMGRGVDPTYRLGAATPLHDLPEYREYADSVRSLGTWIMGLGFAAVVVAAVALTLAGYNVMQQRADVVLTRGMSSATDLLEANAYPLLAFLTSGIFSACWLLAGSRMRALRSLSLVKGLLVVSMIPCAGAWCLVGLPVGGWAFYRLLDKKAAAVFGRG